MIDGFCGSEACKREQKRLVEERMRKQYPDGPYRPRRARGEPRMRHDWD
jgi:hypothetical protein